MLLPEFAGCDQSQQQPSSASSSLTPVAPVAPVAPLASTASPATAEMGHAAALQPALFASPPASPPQIYGSHAFPDLLTTCRNLQALLSAPALPVLPMTRASLLPITPPQYHQELLPAVAASCPASPTPVRRQPLTAAAPMRLRLRPRRVAPAGEAGSPAAGAAIARKRIVRRSTNTAAPAPRPARGPNKRRREAGDEDGDTTDDADDVVDEDQEEADSRLDTEARAVPAHPYFLAPSSMCRMLSSPRRSMDDVGSTAPPPTTVAADASSSSSPPRPQTPKRARIAPAALPLGLARSDYHALHVDGVPDDSSSSSNSSRDRRPCQRSDQDFGGADTFAEDPADGHDDDMWTTEEDRMLVELVLEKLKLSKTEWQECARTLGRRDRHSLGRRWKSLMLHGEIGLRPAVGSAQGARGSRRSRLHGTWR